MRSSRTVPGGSPRPMTLVRLVGLVRGAWCAVERAKCAFGLTLPAEGAFGTVGGGW